MATRTIKKFKVENVNEWAIDMQPHLESLLRRTCSSLRIDVYTGEYLKITACFSKSNSNRKRSNVISIFFKK